MVDALLANRGTSFFEAEHYLLGDGAPVKLPFPKKHQVQTYVDGQLVFTIQEDWKAFKSGDLLSYDLAALKADAATAKPLLVMHPGPRQAIQAVDSTDGKLVVAAARGREGRRRRLRLRRRPVDRRGACRCRRTRRWRSDRPRPKTTGCSSPSRASWTPTSLWAADAATGKAEKIKSLPARFDASTHLVEQFWATSSDGTRIPYFVVRPKGPPSWTARSRPRCTATAASRSPSRRSTCPRRASSGWSAAAPMSSPTSAAAASSARPGTRACCARSASSPSTTSPRWPGTCSRARSPRRDASASTAAPTAGC